MAGRKSADSGEMCSRVRSCIGANLKAVVESASGGES